MSVSSKKDENVLSDDDKPYNSDQEEYDEDEDDDEEEETDEDDEDDDNLDEPKLRYRRVGASVKELLDKDTASTLRVSDRFVVYLNRFIYPKIMIFILINIIGSRHSLGRCSYP